jgi:hypothetical protein
MSKLKLSHSARELYTLCPKKYQFRYIKGLKPKAKGAALFFGSAFDSAVEVLFKGQTLQEAKSLFSDKWLANEGNYNVKFAKTDYSDKILENSDINSLESVLHNLPDSAELKESEGDVLLYLKLLGKTNENSYKRDLKDLELNFIHYANLLSLHRKGLLMLDSFYENIYKHITEVVAFQKKIEIPHPHGHEVVGYIDLICKMEGYILPSGKVLTSEDYVIADVKSAGAASWKNHDHLDKSSQLDTYLIATQHEYPTNLVAYFVTSKQLSTQEDSFCESCGAKKESRHKTCAAEIPGKGRCGGQWTSLTKYYVDSKIVIGERKVEEAAVMLQDFDDILTGIQNHVFPRNRNSCEAFGGFCEYMSICGKCYSTPEQEEEALNSWKKDLGE